MDGLCSSFPIGHDEGFCFSPPEYFYGLPEDLELTVISYPEWYTLRESE